MLPPNNNVVRLVAKNQPAAKSLNIPALGADADIIVNINNQTI